MEGIELILTRSSLRRLACIGLALDTLPGYEIRQTEDKEKAAQLLEEAIQAEEEKIASRDGVTVFNDNNLPGYGVNYDNLSCFRGKGQERFDMNYNLVRQIWHGLNYVEIPEENSGVPHQFLAAMNTFEILSLYRAFGKLMKDSKIPIGNGKETISQEQLKTMSVEMIISKMVGYGCRHKAIQTMRKRGWTYFPTARGYLIKRITPFHGQLKTKFKKLLDNRKRTTEITSPSPGEFDFHDPCYDGKDARRGLIVIKGPLGRKKYTQAIAGFMNNLYIRNTQQKA